MPLPDLREGESPGGPRSPGASQPASQLLDEVLPLFCRTHQHEAPRGRQIFVNRNLRMDAVDLVGFDMDYTLAIYHLQRIEELSFQMTLRRLIEKKGYPEPIGALRYDHDFVIRGLVVDKQHGNIFKMDRHNHVGRVYHGKRPLDPAQIQALYRNEKIRLSLPRFAWIDTLFALPEACLYAEIIEWHEGAGRPLDYTQLYDDVRESIDEVHRDGSLKAVMKQDLARYILKDAELGPALHKLRSAGKKLFLLTNSFWDYTDAVMRFLLDGVLPEYPSWRHFFDVLIVGAQKPSFFSEGNPLYELNGDGAIEGPAKSLERGRIYQGGNLTDFERLAGIGGERVLYVGDHIYGDIIRNRKASLWRTCMVVQELEEEIAYTDRHAAELAGLRDLDGLRTRLDDELNHHKLLLNQLDRRLERLHELGSGKGEAILTLEAERRVGKQNLERLRRAMKEVNGEIERHETEFEQGRNRYWGLIFKEGSENSRFGEQVEDYACLYTSRASNFISYSPMQFFRSPRATMPHERGIVNGH